MNVDTSGDAQGATSTDTRATASTEQPSTTAPERRVSTRMVVLLGLLVSAVLAGVVSAFASSNPDGLEFVAEELGFDATAGDHHLEGSALADYAVRGLGDGGLSGGLAGLIGLAVVAAVTFGLVWLLRRRPVRSATPARDSDIRS